MVFKPRADEETEMTYDEFITKEGVSLPITGFEDLVFDYLEALDKEDAYNIPVEEIINAIFTAQALVPHVAELNDNYIVEDILPVHGGNSVH